MMFYAPIRSCSLIGCLILAAITVCPPAAHALSVAYTFGGTTNLAAINGVPVNNFDTFQGFLSFDTDAQVISSTSSSAQYFDPNASLIISFDNVGFAATGGLTISINRIDIPVFQFSSMTFSTNSVATFGTQEPIASMSLAFSGPLNGLPSIALPATISDILASTFTIISPDFVPSPQEPPRDDVISGTLTTRVKVAAPVPLPNTLPVTTLAMLIIAMRLRKFPRRLTGVEVAR